jgi:hypothetical protein
MNKKEKYKVKLNFILYKIINLPKPLCNIICEYYIIQQILDKHFDRETFNLYTTDKYKNLVKFKAMPDDGISFIELLSEGIYLMKIGFYYTNLCISKCKYCELKCKDKRTNIQKPTYCEFKTLHEYNIVEQEINKKGKSYIGIRNGGEKGFPLEIDIISLIKCNPSRKEMLNSALK